MDDILLEHVLNALPAEEAATVEAAAANDPAVAATLARLRRVLAPLAVDREAFLPPAGLAVATVARLAADIVANDPRSAPHPALIEPGRVRARPRWMGRWLQAGLAAGIGFLIFGMIAGTMARLQADSRRVACTNNLLQLYGALDSYAGTHDGQYPKIGSPGVPTAGGFADILRESGHLPLGVSLACPAGDAPTRVAGYAYTLGYRPSAEAALVGVNRGVAATDPQTPLAADLPGVDLPGIDVRRSPHGRGQNVLFVDGRVGYFTVATVGPGGDHIYLNDDGIVGAGLRPADVCLGRPVDCP